jgi:hypothetical protein
VGLMDGNGNVQVNQWRMKYLQYRLIIKLNNHFFNKTMLVDIAKCIGGTVRITKQQDEVIWVMDDKNKIVETIKIFAMYPPLTSRLSCQVKFMKNCLKDNSLPNYINNRNKKYNGQLGLIETNKNLPIPPYFPS